MSGFTSSGRNNPCPMCDRTKDGDCRVTDSGIVLCHTELNGVKKGERHPERPFVYCGHSDEAQGFGTWKPEHLCEEKPEKPKREAKTQYFDYCFWDGTPTPAQRYRKDFADGRPKEVKWCRGGLQGRPQTDVAPYCWHEMSARAADGELLFIAKGELKVQQLQAEGYPAISILGISETLTANLRAFGASVVLTPDCDLKDLDGWYRELSNQLPEARTLMPPLKGMNWRNPPEGGGLGVEDWLQQSKPDAGAIQSAITSNPWKPVTKPQGVTPWTNIDGSIFDRANSQLAWGKQKLSADQKYSCVLTNVKALCKRIRNAKRRIYRIRLAIDALEMKNKLTAKEVQQLVLETLDDLSGNSYHALTAADRKNLVIPEVEWIFPDLVPDRDGAILGGRPKVGKTVLVYSAIAALLKQQPFLGQPATKKRKVILISDDQGDANTRDLLQKYGVWDHPDLIWSSRFRMSESQIDRLLETIDANPGALVVVDSLRSTTRSSGYTEMDVEMGTILYDLKQAIVDAGGALWIIHHCNKSDDNAVGVEAISGSTSLTGAVNFTATLHHLIAEGKPQKSRPDRRLFSEGRGKGLDLLIAISPETGSVAVQSGFEEHQEQERIQANLIDPVAKILNVDLTFKLAFLALYESEAVDANSGLGPLDLLKHLHLVPITVRVMADLDEDQSKAYTNLTRYLNKLTGFVEKGNPSGQKFKAYYLTAEGREWASQQDWQS